MELPVLPPTGKKPWFAEGLDFTCSQCGNCCTGGPGFVWVTEDEIRKAAEHLQLTITDFKKQYCRKIGGKTSFKEIRRPNGNHDCVFLKEIPVKSEKKDLAEG